MNMIIFLGILYNFICVVFFCFLLEDWLLLDIKVRVQKVEIVIYGIVRVSFCYGLKDDIEGFYSVLFEVYCIFKGKMLFQFVNVFGFGFVGGLCIYICVYLNKIYVVLFCKGIRIGVKGFQFLVNEVNIESVIILIKVSNLVFKKIMEIVGENVS